MIEEKLREILRILWEKGHSGMYEGTIDQAISQIKSLVIESLGGKKRGSCKSWCNMPDCAYKDGCNDHIAEMKKKWK